MKTNPITRALFPIVGFCFLAVSLMTGCAWSIEGDNIRVNSTDDSLEESAP